MDETELEHLRKVKEKAKEVVQCLVLENHHLPSFTKGKIESLAAELFEPGE